MHSNIETTIERFLSEVVERGIIKDLEPLRIRIISIEPRPATTEPAKVESVDLTLVNGEEEADKIDDGVF